MNRTVYKYFFDDIPNYPQCIEISKDKLSNFLEHNLIKYSSSKKKKSNIILSLKKIHLTLTKNLFKVSFQPIFKNNANDNVWYPIS